MFLPSINTMSIHMYDTPINLDPAVTAPAISTGLSEDHTHLNIKSSRMPTRHRPPLYQLPKPSLLLLRCTRLRRERRRHLAHLITRPRPTIIAQSSYRAVRRPRRRRRLCELWQVVRRRSLALMIRRRRKLRQMVWRWSGRRCMLGCRRSGHELLGHWLVCY